MKLRHNYAVEELVAVWKEHREGIWKAANEKRAEATTQAGHRDGEVIERPKKRRRVGAEAPVVVQKSGLEERRSTRSQSRKGASQSQSQSQASQPLPSTQEEIADSDGASEYRDSPSRATPQRQVLQPAEPHDGLVGCPSCGRRLREANINTHLDKCLQGMASPTPPPPQAAVQAPSISSPNSHVRAGTIAYTQTKPTGTSKTPLPTINYNLLTETKLRGKLKDLGIPNHGNKDLMRKRHGEWVNLWNANCDSLQPVSKGKLLRDLDIWERNYARDERSRNVGASGSGGAVMEKEFDREGYMKKEKDNFSDLVKMARDSAKRAAAARKEEEVEQRVEEAGEAVEQQPPVLTAAAGEADVDTAMQNADRNDMLNDGTTTEPAFVPPENTISTTDRAHETLVPSTPPQAQVNEPHSPHHGCPPNVQQEHYQQHEPIDLTTPSPHKSQQGYQQYPQQRLERASQVSL